MKKTIKITKASKDELLRQEQLKAALEESKKTQTYLRFLKIAP